MGTGRDGAGRLRAPAEGGAGPPPAAGNAPLSLHRRHGGRGAAEEAGGWESQGAGRLRRGGDGDPRRGRGLWRGTRLGSARLGSAGTRGEQSLGGGVRFVLPRVPLPLSLPSSMPARGRGRPRRGERHRWRRSPAPRRLAPEPFKPRRLPVRLPGGLQSRQLRLSVLLMPLRKGGLRAPRAV